MINSFCVRDYCYLNGVGICDSHGHIAKYLTYSMLDQAKNTIVSMFVIQVTEAGNSNNMERLGFIESLNNLKEKSVQIQQITTNRHRQIWKYICEEQKGITQQFDV